MNYIGLCSRDVSCALLSHRRPKSKPSIYGIILLRTHLLKAYSAKVLVVITGFASAAQFVNGERMKHGTACFEALAMMM